MDRRSWIRPGRAIVVVCAASALTILPSAAHGAAPVQGLGELQRTVGQAVSQAVDLTKPARRPVTPAPAPAPKPAAPAPAPRAASAAPAAAPQRPAAPVRRARAARASSSRKGKSSARAARKAPSPAPSRSSATQPAESAAAPATTPRTVFATAADLGTGDDETSLPFTGSNMLPLLLVAVLVLLTGIGLKRAVRLR